MIQPTSGGDGEEDEMPKGMKKDMFTPLPVVVCPYCGGRNLRKLAYSAYGKICEDCRVNFSVEFGWRMRGKKKS